MKLISETVEHSEVDGKHVVIVDRLFEVAGEDDFGIQYLGYLPQRLTLLKSTYDKVKHENQREFR